MILPHCYDLGWASSARTLTGRPDLFTDPDEEALRGFFNARLSDGSHILLAEEDNVDVVGYLLAEHMQRDANPFKRASSILYIHHIAVDSASQASGVGSELIAAATELTSELGASSLRLDSWHFNTEAHGFFQAKHFTPVNIVFERRLAQFPSSTAE